MRSVENEFLTEACECFYRQWLKWRSGRLLPEYSDIIYDDVQPLMPSLVLLRYESSRSIVFRHVGDAVRGAFGRDVTGEEFRTMADPKYRFERSRRVHNIITHPCGAVRITTAILSSDRERDLEYLSLPVASDESGLPNQVLSFAGLAGAHDPSDSVSKVNVRTLAKEFRYIDIGAGVPVQRRAQAR